MRRQRAGSTLPTWLATLAAAALLSLALTAGSAAARPQTTALGHRAIPVGVANVNNQSFTSGRLVYAIRFVLDQDTRIHRFLSGFSLEGTDRMGGRPHYAHGNGGTIWARLVQVDRRGRPDLDHVIASERVNPVKRYFQTLAAYRISPYRTAFLHFNMGGVRLRHGRMYAMTYANASRKPWENWFSTNSPVVKASEAGPNGRNTLNPDAPGAIMGLDPREAVGWSVNRGRHWVWGRRVGEGRARFSYGGSVTNDNGARLPWYAWQSRPGSRPRSNQPYYGYRESGSFTLVLSRAPRAVTLTEAGGYAPVRRSVGSVTVTNLRTGATGTTAPLGSGIVKGRLSPPVPVAAGDSYTISNTGTVFKAEGDYFLERILGLGRGHYPFSTVGFGLDRAELFALPHPFY